jgi:phage tail-like protein
LAVSEDGYLVVTLDGEVVRTVPLTFAVLTIGRAPDNGLSLVHSGVSRYHAELRRTEEGLIVTDLRSANGTHLDGVRLMPQQPARLEPGSTLRIGPFELLERRPPTEEETALQTPAIGEPEHAPRRPRATASAPVVYGEQQSRFLTGRPTRPVELRDSQLSMYLKYLPTIFSEPDGLASARGRDFMGRFLMIFESIWEPLEQRQDHVAMYFDPDTCPAAFLYWLASWFDLAVGAHWPEGRIRSLLGQAMELYRWRGTRYGMAQMIEVWTGLSPEIIESKNDPYVFMVRLRVPAGAAIDRLLVEDLLRAHKPAHAGFVLEILR